MSSTGISEQALEELKAAIGYQIQAAVSPIHEEIAEMKADIASINTAVTDERNTSELKKQL